MNERPNVRRFAGRSMIAVVLSVVAGSAAQAQFDAHSFDQTAPYSASELERFFTDHDLRDRDAAVLIRAFAEEFHAAYRAAWEQAARAIRQDRSPESQIAWEEERAKIVERFEGDVRMVLPEDRRDAWDAFTASQTRARRMHLLNPHGAIRAVVNLRTVIDGFDLPPDSRAQADALLSEYMAELDAILLKFDQRRMPFMREFQAVRQAVADGKKDAREREQDLVSELRSFVARIAKLNALYQNRLLGLMEGDARGVLVQALRVRQYKHLYAASPADIIMGTLRSVEPAPAEMGTIEGTYTAYMGRRSGLRGRVLRGLDKWNKPKRVAERDERLRVLTERYERGEDVDPGEAWTGCEAVGPLRQLLQLERDTVLEIRATLTPDEIALCPAGVRALFQWAESAR